MKAYDIAVISYIRATAALVFLCFLCQKKRSTLCPSLPHHGHDLEKAQSSEKTTAPSNGGVFILTGAAAMAIMSGGYGGGGDGGCGCDGGGCSGGC